MITVEQLEERRGVMSLADRIRARRDLDTAAGISYAAPRVSDGDLIRFIHILRTGPGAAVPQKNLVLTE